MMREEAERAARTLYGRAPQSPEHVSDPTEPLLFGNDHVVHYDTLPPVSTDYVPPERRKVCCGTVSPVRRTFCLLVTFDVILTSVLWVIFAQGEETTDKKLEFLEHEIANYSFQTSLFDTVLCSAGRSVPLLLAYALFHLNNASVVAVTTAGTCVFIIAKVFLFSWPSGRDNFMTYIILIETLVIAWVETWMLDFKVLPRERRANATEAYRQLVRHRPQSWQRSRPHSTAPSEFFSLPPSRDEMEPRQGIDVTQAFRSHGDSESTLLLTQDPDAAANQQKARDTWYAVEQLMATEDWKASAQQDGCTVTYKHVSGLGKVFRLQATVHSSMQRLFHTLIVNCVDTPLWNPTMLECRVLQVIDYQTDVCYNVCADALKGAVKSRDFVDLRHWRNIGDKCILAVGCAIEHRAMPTQPGRVRGENRLVGWMLETVRDTPPTTNITWLISSDLKGWMLQSVSDAALTGVMLDFVKHLRLHLGC